MPPIRLIRDDELESLPVPPTLITDVLPQGALGMLYGPSGVGKTFVALDIALSIATGRPWFDYPVTRGSVVYVMAEGVGGLAMRVRAWKHANGVTEPCGVYFLPSPINLADPEEIIQLIIAMKSVTPCPVMVIVDTLARCLGGRDENSATDMSVIIGHAGMVSQQTGAAVLFIHHTGKNEGGERGSSALRAAMDCVISVKGESDAFWITSDKAKDLPPFEGIWAALIPQEQSRIVAKKSGSITGPSKRQQEALAALAGFENLPASNTKWKQASGLNESTFNAARKVLVNMGYVTSVKDTGKPGYILTEKGHTWITANSNSTANALQCSTGTSLHAISHPPIGGDCSNTAAVENGDITGSGKGTP